MARDAKGRWLPGTSGNKGNRYTHSGFTKKWLHSCKESDVAKIYKVVVANALAGEYKYIKLFMEYTIQRPDNRLVEEPAEPSRNPDEIRQLFLDTFSKQPKYDS